MTWDLFCRVVDNFGDIGVCWRLATQLAGRGQQVRLWTDDASALRWMAPQHRSTHPMIAVCDWALAADAASAVRPGEVVIEAFGCDPPPAFVARIAEARLRSGRQPLWINLEYLSAERHVEPSHLLQSPQTVGVAAGLLKYFYFPGFSDASGGLLREPALLQRLACFDAAAWLAGHAIERRPGEQLVSLFCYPSAPLAGLLDRLAADGQAPTLLLLTAGAASEQVSALLGPSLCRGPLRAIALPWLSQPDYDHLLWSCDINFVRGEDSAVRAQWAGRPFVWQLYPQSDGADIQKADAFLTRFLAPLPATLPDPPQAAHLAPFTAALPPDLPAPLLAEPARQAADALRRDLIRLWHGWNGWDDLPRHLPQRDDWAAQCSGWRAYLAGQPDLTSRLLSFVQKAG